MTAGYVAHDRFTPLRIGRFPEQVLFQRLVIGTFDERLGVARLIEYFQCARLFEQQQAGVLMFHTVDQRTLNEKTQRPPWLLCSERETFHYQIEASARETAALETEQCLGDEG